MLKPKPRTYQVAVRYPLPLIERAERLAQGERRTMADMMRILLEDGLDTRETAALQPKPNRTERHL